MRWIALAAIGLGGALIIYGLIRPVFRRRRKYDAGAVSEYLDRAAPRALRRRLALSRLATITTSVDDGNHRDDRREQRQHRNQNRPCQLQGGEDGIPEARGRRRTLQPQQRRRRMHEACGAAGPDNRNRGTAARAANR